MDAPRRLDLVGRDTVEDLLNAWLRRREKVLEETSLRKCRQARVRYRAPKHFRHTYAQRMLTAGETLGAISAELGHKDVAVTARVYAGFLAELEDRGFGALAAERYAENCKDIV